MERAASAEIAALSLATIRAMLPAVQQGQTGAALVAPAIPPVTQPLPLQNVPLRPLTAEQRDNVLRVLSALPKIVDRLADMAECLAACGIHPSQALDGSSQLWGNISDPTGVARHQLAALYAAMLSIATQGGVRRGH